MKILYVDDDSAMRYVVTRTLAKLGFEAESAPDGPAALSRLRADQPHIDALVTDLTMPEMSGVELAHAVKAFAPALPIIAFSGSVLQFLQSGEQARLFAAVVAKGATLAALSDAILRAVGAAA